MQNHSSGVDAEGVLKWLRWADTDYRGARLCLLAGLVVQGAALSNTAIEKYVKSLFVHQGLRIPRSHKVSELFTLLKQQRKTDIALNESYLRLLEKAYALRYPDDLTEGFNIALNQKRLLAELDRTVFRLTSRFNIMQIQTKQRIPLVVERAINDGDAGILADNIALNAAAADTFFSSESRSYDLRMHSGNIYETEYTTVSVKDEQDHETEGFRVIDLNGPQLQVAYLPMLPSPNSASVNGLGQLQVEENRNP
jgi:HEPN domain-containing protein